MSFREDLTATAVAQWEWFGKDTKRGDHFILPDGKTTSAPSTHGKANPRKETVEPYASRIADYWLAIGSADYNRLVKQYAPHKGRLDGTVDIAWSAAFISYCMQMAGAGASFPYAGGHAVWMTKSIANRAAGKLNAPLVGYRPGELPLTPGDLIGRPRQAGVTYDNAVAKGWFVSHSDIVVEVDPARRLAFTIGGNVGQTVSRAQVSVNAAGALDDDGGWIVHIQNNIAKTPGAPAPAIAAAEAKVG